MQITTCIPKKNEGDINSPPTKADWRKFGITQRFLIPKENVEPCKQKKEGKMLDTLCPLNERGTREIASIERRFGPIMHSTGGSKDEYTVSKLPKKYI